MDIKLETHTFHMSKDAFFYAYKTLTKDESYNVFLESGRGGRLSVAAWNPIAVAKSVDSDLHILWR
ncbi:MAG: aminodeoxychorismate synthase component I, partial [Psychrobacillus psychrodurans]